MFDAGLIGLVHGRESPHPFPPTSFATMPISYFTAQADLPAHGIHAGDTLSLNDENPDEPVMVHRPAVGVGVAEFLVWVHAGAVRPAIPSGVVSEGLASTSPARPRLRLLRPDDQQTA